MINIFTYQNLIEEINKNTKKKEQIIGFVYAPYNQTKIAKIVDQFYDWWQLNNSEILQFFWLGYYEGEKMHSEYCFRVNSHKSSLVHFNLQLFETLRKEVNKHWNYTYNEHFEIVFVRKYENKIDFKKKIRIDFDKYFNSVDDTRDIFAQIRNVVEEYKTFSALEKEIKNRKCLKRLRIVSFETLISLIPNFTKSHV